MICMAICKSCVLRQDCGVAVHVLVPCVAVVCVAPPQARARAPEASLRNTAHKDLPAWANG